MGLPLSDVVRSELIRRFSEEARELLDRAHVTAYSVCREVTTLEFFQHQFA